MWIVVILVVLFNSSTGQQSCVVKFDSVSYGLGFVNETFTKVQYCVYLGVRYAEAPVGSLRFRNPVLHNTTGPQNFTKVGNICPQRVDINKPTDLIGEEDCLFLNIYSPFVAGNGSNAAIKYPVLVFIHGGTFVAGSALTDVVYGVDLLIESGVLVVSINYRLYTLGFLRYPPLNITGNFGLKDQRIALRWVQKNIKLFGGDPKRVTLMGQSAGAGSVTLHMYAEHSQGLFHQTVALGGAMIAPWATFLNPQILADEVISRFNVSTLEQLQEMDYKQFMFTDSFDTYGFFNMFYPGFVPTVETGEDSEPFITTTPHELVLSKPINEVPTIIEHTATEFEFLLHNLDFFFMGKNFPNKNNKDQLKSVTKLLMAKVRILRDTGFFRKLANTANLIYPIKRLLRHLAKQLDQTPVYYLRFEFDGRFGFYKNEYYKNKINGGRYGAVHGDDLGYIFSPYVIKEALANRSEYQSEWKVHERTVELLANFVKYGNPTPKKSKLSNILWPAYNENSTYPQFLNIDRSFEVRTDRDVDDEFFCFWERIYQCLYYYECDMEEPVGKESDIPKQNKTIIAVYSDVRQNVVVDLE
ncbi:juvenile hormone esterase-like [Malaya genurostris]|uniref:juvenile hormone esterase-like n=1 Tax=Malaya genurostris TaxID=325434 RepID=UPI0026F3C637|nr:juvenile hormone esterase-like [Malaya genurostris]